MSSREVIDNLLRGRKATRVGLYDKPWSDTLDCWIDQGYPVDESGKPAAAVEHFDFDMAGCGGWFDILPLRGVSEIEEETDDWVVKRNGAGAALKKWKNKSGTPEHIDFRMTSREVWERDYRDHLLKLDRDRLNFESTSQSLEKHKKAGRWTYYGNIFIWENMRQSMGDFCLYESLLLDPEWIKDYGRVYTDFFKMHYNALFERSGLPNGIWMFEDLGYKDNLFCSPDILKELIFPYYSEMVEFFHSYDLPVVLHTCGLVEPVVDLIVEAGFDALNPMEVKAGNDPLRIARKYKDQLAFVGGLDARVLESGDRELIRDRVAALVEGMKEMGARYVFGSDHSLSPNVDYEDFNFALEVYRECMWY